MPASLTRTCRSCGLDKATPSDFRDLGEAGPGRPPSVCRECRIVYPALAAAYEETKAARRASTLYRQALGARSDYAVFAEMVARHPDGYKVCPEVSGCGEALPLWEFAVERRQADGLAGVCRRCKEEHKALLQVKS